MMTGSKQVLVRSGYSDYAAYLDGYYMAATGNLDAPDLIPQGSVRIHNTMVPCPVRSLAHRDWESGLTMGCAHDGPEPAWVHLEGTGR